MSLRAIANRASTLAKCLDITSQFFNANQAQSKHMPFFHSKSLQIYFEQHGARSDPPVLLIHGIGCQLVQWPDTFVQGFVSAGYRVLLLDNRDVGLSAKLDDLGTPDVMQLMAALLAGGQTSGETGAAPAAAAPYSITDMAADAVALLDHLGQAGAHVIGVSMGGMIAQQMAIQFPGRVFSLTSIMSSSGAAGLPQAEPAAAAALVTPATAADRATVVAQMHNTWNIIGGPHYESDVCGIGRLAGAAFDRCYHPTGFNRQLAAIVTDVHRANDLAKVQAPTLVVHGDADPLVPLAAGRDTAARIPGAELHVVENMGHDLPEPLIPALVATITAHLGNAHTRR